MPILLTKEEQPDKLSVINGINNQIISNQPSLTSSPSSISVLSFVKKTANNSNQNNLELNFLDNTSKESSYSMLAAATTSTLESSSSTSSSTTLSTSSSSSTTSTPSLSTTTTITTATALTPIISQTSSKTGQTGTNPSITTTATTTITTTTNTNATTDDNVANFNISIGNASESSVIAVSQHNDSLSSPQPTSTIVDTITPVTVMATIAGSNNIQSIDTIDSSNCHSIIASAAAGSAPPSICIGLGQQQQQQQHSDDIVISSSISAVASVPTTSILNGTNNGSLLTTTNSIAGLLDPSLNLKQQHQQHHNQHQQQQHHHHHHQHQQSQSPQPPPMQHSPIEQAVAKAIGDLNLNSSNGNTLANMLNGGGFMDQHQQHSHQHQHHPHPHHHSNNSIGNSGGGGGVGGGGNGTSNNVQNLGPAMWSTADDGNHMPPMNGFGNFQNFSTPPLYNGGLGGPGNMQGHQQQHPQQQHQRRAITSQQQQQTNNFPHGLSPNRSGNGNGCGGGGGGQMMPNSTSPNLQHQPHQHNMYNKNPYPAWANSAAASAGQSVPWSPQQQQHHHQQQHQNQNNMAQWNRGRSVPNLNPMSGGNNSGGGGGGGNGMSLNRKQLSPNPPGPSQTSPFGSQSGGGSGMSGISPSKYRRSTSFPGKGSSPSGGVSGVGGGGGVGGVGSSGYQLDVPNLDDARGDVFLGSGGSGYQDRSGMGNGLDMRSLEHCLSDIMRNVGDSSQPDHLKGFLNCNSNTLQSLAQLHGKPYFDDHITEETGGFVDGNNLTLNSPSRSSPHSQGSEITERFSRKVFVGGLPPDIDEDEITTSFRRFGPLVVDWPHKAESKSYFPPKGYAFLLFQDESSVQQLIEACITDEEKLYLCVSSPTIKDKPVQIRPWRLADADFVLDASMPLDPRKTVFVGGVPRPLKAVELAMIMDRLYGGVCYAGIDTDPELKYPKGAGRVAFANQQSYIAAISARFVQLQHGDIDKRVEVKPYVLDDQMCDECQGQRCSGKFAPFFCANVTCLQYYCEHCWAAIHSRPGREYHKPLVKEGADRPRAVPFRWC